MIARPLPFPAAGPTGYEPLAREPAFDPARHLALERPARTWALADLGYDAATIAASASPLAATSPFRLLSEEGVQTLLEISRTLHGSRTELAGNRVPSHLAGGVYRSRFLRALCGCPLIAEFLSEIAGTPLAPHSMPSQQVYVNYAPRDITKAVDAWHFDGIGFDYVLMVSDPAPLAGGGDFQFFLGTVQEATALLGTDYLRRGSTGELPAARVVTARFPAAGHAVFQQGNRVVHRASRLLVPTERITLVPGYVSLEAGYPDPTAIEDMAHYREPGILAEVCRHAAWQARSRLDDFIERVPPDAGRETLCEELRAASADIERVIRALWSPSQRG